MRPLAVIGHLSRDLVAGGPPRIGGGPWYAGRALLLLGDEAILFAKCGDDDRARFQRRLASVGLPASLSTRGITTSFSFSYSRDGERTMSVEAIGEPWQLDEPQSTLLRRVDWLHVAPLLRGRQLGPLTLDADYDAELLRHVSILKVSEEEARVLEPLTELGLPEIVLTRGIAGSVVFVHGRPEEIPARPVEGEVDPTGAGDAFAVSYLAARADGHAPVSAARRATALVAALLLGQTR